MSDEFPDPDEEFDYIHQEDYEVLKEQESALFGKSQSSELVFNGISQATSSNIQQTNVPISTSDNLENIIDNNSQGNNKKRNYEELFGDISDLLGADISIDIEEPKEKKLRWDQHKDIIQKIVEARQLLHEDIGSTLTKTKYEENKKDSISLRIPPWNFIAVTRTYDSQRLYVRVRKNFKNNIKLCSRPVTNLLSIPYRQLKSQAEDILRKQELSKQVPSDLCNMKDIIKNDELWVDKYQPRSYAELLSDETVNRELLCWLKLWDKVVFNRNFTKPKKEKSNVFQFGKRKKTDNDNIEEVDSKGYPIKRIALLCGPPGLGKTTLAHIVAKHVGYNVVEINASDERSADTFKQILLASTEMKAVIGADPRPNCLIFDEIDGAPAAAVDLLLKFVQGKLVAKTKKGGKVSEQTSNGCTRPIVCICNEPYAPTLRTLRAAAMIISITEISPFRLADRLLEITKKENLNVDFGDLLKLAERSGCDVRSCVGALQYMGSANFKDNLYLGLKNTRKNLFDSWRTILTIPMNRKGVVSIADRITNIWITVQNGENEKLIQGIFHNYPEVCDRKLDNIFMSLEWFQFYDLITSLVMHKQIWSLMPYTNYGFIAWHLHLARAQKIKLSYPTFFNEVTQKSAKNTGILTAIRRVCGRDTLTLTTDVAGFLPELLTPRLRTVPSHLYSLREKADLVKIVNVMIEYGLSFVQEKNSQGGYIYNIDPNILEIGILPDCNMHRSLTYAVKQIIAQELEIERLKRANISMGFSKDSSVNAKKPESREKQKNIEDKSAVPNNKKFEKNVPLKETVYKDFFGNIITRNKENGQNQNKTVDNISSENQKGNSDLQNILTKHGIWYKYKEGCNNAVRRNVSMKKLL